MKSEDTSAAQEIVEYILSAYSVKSAVSFGRDAEPFVSAFRRRGVKVSWDKDGDEPSAVGDASDDLCICINYCDYLTISQSDKLIDFLCEHFSLILFEGGVPSKKRPSERTDQVQHYWASMFELRGLILVKGFEQNRMPFLFRSENDFDHTESLVGVRSSTAFEWRERFATTVEHRSPLPSTRKGRDTSGETCRIAAGVVTFEPNVRDLEVIRSLSDVFNLVIVADNSEPALERLSCAEWVPMGGNKGVAAALNAVCKRAKDLGCDWLLTLDQDAAFSEREIGTYLEAFAAYDDKECTAIVAPRINAKDVPAPGVEVQEMEMVITSGSLMNLAIWDELGGFTEELFIDEVDHDYCLKALTHGYRIIKLNRVLITHQAGSLKTVLTLRGRPAIASAHPPLRLYYMARNYFYLKNRYDRTFPHIVAFQRQHLIGKFKEYLLYHENRWPSIFAMLKGAVHGLAGRFGRY